MNKYKKIFVFLFIIITTVVVTLFVGCSNSASGDYYNPGENYAKGDSIDSSDVTYAEGEGVSERKIIYTVTAQIIVENVSESVNNAEALLKEGEWIQSSSENSSYSTIVFRIKTDRLEEFIDAIKTLGDVSRTEKNSKDVSLDYYDNTLQKESLTAERTRLVELLEKASSVSEFIQINERLTKIDKQLMEIEGTLKNYDSLVDYSEVTVSFSVKGTSYEAPTFGEKLADGYESSWEFAKELIIGILVALPFIVVIGGIVIGIIFAVKAYRKKKGYVDFKRVPPVINEPIKSREQQTEVVVDEAENGEDASSDTIENKNDE